MQVQAGWASTVSPSVTGCLKSSVWYLYPLWAVLGLLGLILVSTAHSEPQAQPPHTSFPSILAIDLPFTASPLPLNFIHCVISPLNFQTSRRPALKP